ncbi:MAG: VWA domain-containing protein, partial [Silvibacterium sp.]|nr:VWA domain-containing protein [Silvibacterium sp.]
MLRRFRLLTPVLLLCPFLAAAQSESQSQPPPGSKPYTIQANSRVVLTDVTVTDSKGRPVHGLSQSTFRIFDDDKPQTISSFEEHRGTARDVIETGAIERGVYSDDYLLHLPPVLSVVLIDIANLEITEQIYLYYELTKFFERQGTGQPVAIYLRAGGGCFLVQNFTTNRDLLLKALRKAIPRIPPTGREYLSDIDTLSQITAYLSQFPGRKNVIWFSGGSTLFLQEDATPYQDLTLNRDAVSFGNATLLQNAEQHD